MLVSRSGLSPVMVERDAELSELRRLFATVAPGMEHPPVVVVSGEAGVGKTRLLRELAGEIEAGGGGVLAGRAEETTLAPPFGLLRDALQAEVATWDGVPEALAARAHPLRHVLSPLLVEHQPHDDHEHTADELLRAAIDCAAYTVGTRPTLLVFEDLHWADAESIALFGRLATTPGLPVLLVGTFRPEEFDRRHPLAHALPRLERLHSVVHLQLGRLTERALARMLEAVFERAVPTAAVAALHQRTQGNPFFVEELVAGCGCTDPAELASAPLPWNAAEAVLRRVDELEGAAARVLSTAALLGSRVPFDLLAAVLDLSEDELIARLRVLVERGLLTETDVDVFAFRHALTREAVASRLLGREQRRIHQAALEILEEQGSDDVLALAHRAAGAGRWDKLVRYAWEGVHRLLREGAAQQALGLAELALGSPEAIPAADEVALRAAAARAALLLRMPDVSAQHTEQWRLLAVEEKLVAAEAAALRHESVLRWTNRDRTGYWRVIGQVREVSAHLEPSAELAWCYAFESQAHMLDGDAAEAIALADRALGMALAVGAPEVRPWALVNKGMVLAETPGTEQEGLDLLEEAAEESLALGDAMTALRALNNALAVHIHQRAETSDDARLLLDRAREVAERHGTELFVWTMTELALGLAVIDGDLAAARALLDDLPLATGNVSDVWVAALRVFLATEGDDLPEALRLIETPPWVAPQAADDGAQAWWHVACLHTAARAGRREAATVAFERLEELVSAGDPAERRSQMLCEAVLAGLGAGIPAERLAALVEQGFTEPARGRHVLFDPAWADHARAALALHAGDHEAAAAAYRTALSGLRLARPAWLAADARMGLAASLGTLGRREEARAEAAQAAGLLRDWPGWRRDAAERLARRLEGASGAAGDGQGAGQGLTPREVEVLALIAEGLSNREIAGRLYIATKTVAVHVSNILAKVGATSRTEAAAWGLRTGAIPAPGSAPA